MKIRVFFLMVYLTLIGNVIIAQENISEKTSNSLPYIGMLFQDGVFLGINNDSIVESYYDNKGNFLFSASAIKSVRSISDKLVFVEKKDGPGRVYNIETKRFLKGLTYRVEKIPFDQKIALKYKDTASVTHIVDSEGNFLFEPSDDLYTNYIYNQLIYSVNGIRKINSSPVPFTNDDYFEFLNDTLIRYCHNKEHKQDENFLAWGADPMSALSYETWKIWDLNRGLLGEMKSREILHPIKNSFPKYYETNGKWCLVNYKDQIIGDVFFDDIQPYENFGVVTKIQDSPIRKLKLYGLINEFGETILPMKYSEITSAKEYFIVEDTITNNDIVLQIPWTGNKYSKKIYHPQEKRFFDPIGNIVHLIDDLFKIKFSDTSKYMIYDVKKEQFISDSLDYINDPVDNYIPLLKDGKEGYVFVDGTTNFAQDSTYSLAKAMNGKTGIFWNHKNSPFHHEPNEVDKRLLTIRDGVVIDTVSIIDTFIRNNEKKYIVSPLTRNGNFYAYLKSGNVGLKSVDGKVILEPIYDYIKVTGKYITVYRGSKIILYEQNGENLKIIFNETEEITDLAISEKTGIAAMKQNDLYSFVRLK